MSIIRYMVDEIAVEPFTGDANVDQQPTYGARVVHPARVEEGRRELRTSAGSIVVDATVIATMATVNPRDRVWAAPDAGINAPRTFPVGYVFVDTDARTPQGLTRARKRAGRDGHLEFHL